MDWPGLMRLGLRELRLSPTDFWALTPAELLVKLGLDASQPGLTRARLNELAAAYPDTDEPMKGNGHGGV